MMRHLINLIEAKAARRQPALDAQKVYTRIFEVAKELASASFVFTTRDGAWEQDWVKEINDGVKSAKMTHDAMEKDNEEYDRESGRTYKPVPFNLADSLPDVTAKWWDNSVKPLLEEILAEVKYQSDEYQDWKPDVESSDQLSLFDAEKHLAENLLYKASDTLQGIMEALTALDSFASALNHAHDIDYSNPCTRSTVKFVKSGFPAMVLITKLWRQTIKSE